MINTGVDHVYFSDQAGASEKMLSVIDHLDNQTFVDLDPEVVVPVIATKRKTDVQIEEIFSRLRDLNISKAFIVSGDDKSSQDGPVSSQIIAKYGGDFKLGAAIHPQLEAEQDYVSKREAGAAFFVVQASYGQVSFDAWVKAWGKSAISESDVTGLTIPPTSRGVIRVLSGLDDVHVSGRFKRAASAVKGGQLEPWGIDYARKRVDDFKRLGMGGAYVYSRSPIIVASVLKT